MIAALYPTKKAMKQAIGQTIKARETSMLKAELVPNKAVPFVGPSERMRKFYGTVTVDEEYKIVKVQ